MPGKDLRQLSLEELMAKHPTSFRLSPGRIGITQPGVIEQAVRKFARTELPAVPTAQEKPRTKRKDK
jgi:hypothetical protein